MSASRNYKQVGARIKDSNNREYIIGEHIGEGALSDVFRATLATDDTRANFVIKLLKYPNDESVDYKENIQNEVEYLNRIYPNKVSTTIYEREIKESFKGKILTSTYKYSALIMPFLEGKTLQDDEYKIPPELENCTFSQRAGLLRQLFQQVRKIHAPSPPAKPAIILDIHGGNIKIDFVNNQLHIFDLGSAIKVNTSRLVDIPEDIEVNAIARSLETVGDGKIGLVSDIFGLVAPTMLILGAKNPSATKQITEEKQNLSQKDAKQILKENFDMTGLLQGFELPTFIISLHRLQLDFLERMQKQEPEDRLQTAAEGEEFFSILENMPTHSDEYKYNDDDYKKAAKLIAIAAGCRNLFTDFDNIAKCREIVDLYNGQPVLALNKVRKVYFEDICEQKSYKDAVDKITTYIDLTHSFKLNLSQIINPKAYEEIFLAYKRGDAKSLTVRFQLMNLLAELEVSNPKKIQEVSQIKIACLTDFADVDKTLELFKQVCQISLRNETINLRESTSGENLKRLLNKEKYAKLANCLDQADRKKVKFEDLHKFAQGRKAGFFEDSLVKLLPSDSSSNISKYKLR